MASEMLGAIRCIVVHLLIDELRVQSLRIRDALACAAQPRMGVFT
jgi:hypothetical protein